MTVKSLCANDNVVGCGSASSKPTSPLLLDLCNLPSDASPDERQARVNTLLSWRELYPVLLSKLLTSEDHRDKKTGCFPLHWAAGTGFDQAIELLLDVDITTSVQEQDERTQQYKLSVDQEAKHPSTHRTPLHYAARNGHLSTCRLLIEKYAADSHPKCGRGGVTPLQLAVWQNRLSIVKYLVEATGHGKDIVQERNGFNCGLMHWIGLVPQKRWGGDDGINGSKEDGSGVIPLARYLHSLGIAFESTPENSNTQGHTPNHKAAWGGNLPLIKFFRDEHDVYDTIQDEAGNFAADIAKMRGNMKVHQWLLEHGSGDRAESYRILGLGVGADRDVVRRRYFELAKQQHPDKSDQSCNNEFVKIKNAYEHLTKENGVGKQKNPKFDEVKLLEDHRRISDNDTDKDGDDLFIARLIAVVSDYGDGGFPVSLIARRWNQIWPDRPFPTDYVIEKRVQCQNNGSMPPYKIIQKKVNLLKWLNWKCKGSSVYFRNNKCGEVLAFEGKNNTTCNEDGSPT